MRSAYVKRIAAAGFAAAFFSLTAQISPTFAADIVRPVPVVVAPKAAVFSWTGCYIGANGGYGWGDKKFSSDTLVFGPAGTTADLHVKGWLAGGQVGCDKQFAGGHVFGVEGMGDWTNIEGSKSLGLGPNGSLPGTLSARINWLASITARLGHANGQHLWYVKGGAAFARETDSLTAADQTCGLRSICTSLQPVQVATTTLSGRAIHAGWTVGVGGEWALHSHWSLGVEYNFYHFGAERVGLQGPTLFGDLPVNVKPTLHTLTAQLNYRF